ncbi:hypothetical protein M427DRAFT_45669 [Gonapodya prolifera JEL478]|uniref:Nudix hydrolase domain-containing protein n=1 Tax=Gonapodya prolifera (strain JEL478) TaxID=1344416 RepID=A0A139AA66_GONPJ|nr:hypothetical protein M427DRAFT_45669 [Gonapodya prolifera JEL478]|eukprot:KXS13554.1 hypothetical protein M427DRAFT_45669 [Gonapodya prolifera JEL478]
MAPLVPGVRRARGTAQNPVVPGDAASLIIVAPRPAGEALSDNDADYKVLLIQRSSRGQFGGLTVFPGGRVEPVDADSRWEPLLQRAANEYRPDAFPKRILKHALAAIRETFEEVGVLILSNPEKRWKKQDIVEWRKRSHADSSAFLDMCQESGAVPLTAALAWWSNWITPKETPRRFDVKFFLAVLPETTDEVISRIKERASADGTEIIGLRWLTPSECMLAVPPVVNYQPTPTTLCTQINNARKEEAMDAFARGEISLIDPQFAQLAELHQRFPKVEQLRAYVRRDQPLLRSAFETTPCCPEFYVDAPGSTVIALPGDPLYSEASDIPGGRVSDRHRILLKMKPESETKNPAIATATNYAEMSYVRSLNFDEEKRPVFRL